MITNITLIDDEDGMFANVLVKGEVDSEMIENIEGVCFQAKGNEPFKEIINTVVRIFREHGYEAIGFENDVIINHSIKILIRI